MAWFKLNLRPQIGEPALLFEIQNQLTCFVDSEFVFTCRDFDFTVLKTQKTQLDVQQWFHLTIAVNSGITSFLQIETNERVCDTAVS